MRSSWSCAKKILGPNVKVSNLAQMVQAARYEHLLVNDSDIRVETRLSAASDCAACRRASRHGDLPLSRSRGRDASDRNLNLWASAPIFVLAFWPRNNWKAACVLGLDRRWLSGAPISNEIGGFRSIVDFLADDYELGRRIADLGLKVVLSDEVVETHLPAYTTCEDFSRISCAGLAACATRDRRIYRAGHHFRTHVGAAEL